MQGMAARVGLRPVIGAGKLEMHALLRNTDDPPIAQLAGERAQSASKTGNEAGANGVEIEVTDAGSDGGVIEEVEATEAGFPVATCDVSLFICSVCDEFVELCGEPAESGAADAASEAVIETDDSILGVSAVGKSLFIASNDELMY